MISIIINIYICYLYKYFEFISVTLELYFKQNKRKTLSQYKKLKLNKFFQTVLV